MNEILKRRHYNIDNYLRIRRKVLTEQDEATKERMNRNKNSLYKLLQYVTSKEDMLKLLEKTIQKINFRKQHFFNLSSEEK